MAIRECSCIQEHLFHGDGFFKLVPRLDKCISVLGYYVTWFIRAMCDDAQCPGQVQFCVYLMLAVHFINMLCKSTPF